MTNPSVSKPAAPMTIKIRTVIFTVCGDHLSVLLQGPAEKTQWALPETAWGANHSLDRTAAHLQTALTGVHDAYLEQLYTYGPPANGLIESISVVYFALIPANSIRSLASQDESTGWFAVDDLPALEQNDAEIIMYALRRLRYKLEYSAVGFELLPETFTLSELQRIYETILGEKLDKRNFRRRILEAGIIESTPDRRSGEGRPAQLYRYRPDAVAEVKARRLFP